MNAKRVGEARFAPATERVANRRKAPGRAPFYFNSAIRRDALYYERTLARSRATARASKIIAAEAETRLCQK